MLLLLLLLLLVVVEVGVFLGCWTGSSCTGQSWCSHPVEMALLANGPQSSGCNQVQQRRATGDGGKQCGGKGGVLWGGISG